MSTPWGLFKHQQDLTFLRHIHQMSQEVYGAILSSNKKKTIFSVGMIVLNVHSGICRRSGVASHSSPLAWKIPWMEEPGGLQSIGVAKSRTRQSDFTFTFHFHALEKEMATLSSVLAWRIPGTGSLVGCRLRGRTESDTTEVTQQQQQWHLYQEILCLV